MRTDIPVMDRRFKGMYQSDCFTNEANCDTIYMRIIIILEMKFMIRRGLNGNEIMRIELPIVL